ncbi:MAG: hypothetical protein RL885_09260 [Planctomycetota bacterium]
MTTNKTHTPLRAGVFSSPREADFAIEKLIESGIDADHISLVRKHPSSKEPFGVEEQSPAGEHTEVGAGAGGAVGGALGTLTAIGIATATGAAILTTGPLLLGAGAVTGGLIGLMMTRGVEEEAADHFEHAVESDKILVVASSKDPETLAKAERCLMQAGSESITALPKG